MNRYPRSILFVVLAIVIVTPLAAAEVKIFRTDNRDAVLAGALDALAVGPLGALELARRVERLAALEEPFVFAAAPHADGWVLGTGNSGKVLLVHRGGRVEELFAAAEPEVFAVHVAGDGSVYAATSPHGKVYRVRDAQGGGAGDVVFDPPDAYVWSLAEDRQGRLLVATGLAGRLYRADPRGDGGAEVLYESSDSHVRAVAALADGRVLLGTAGQGLVLELVDGPKKGGQTVAVATLYDAVQPEVLGFAVAADGTAYAAALASEASRVDLSTTQAPAQSAEAGAGEAQITVMATAGQETLGSRGSGYSGPRSLVLKIHPGGRVEELLTLNDETVHSLLWHADGLWIGTGEEGRLYRWAGDRLVLERDLEERQITALVAAGDGAAAATTNGAALYQMPGDRVAEGKYTSTVLDAGQVARFGSFLWEGELPRGASLELEARSGMSSKPDATWTPWRAAAHNGSGEPRELSLAELAEGRYVQYRAILRGDGGSGPQVAATELSYRQRNLKPQIESFEVLAPSEILVPNNFNPQNQAFEPWSPNREGIFTSLRPEKETDANRQKTLWKKGYRSLRWTVKDANEDELVYALAFRRDDDSGDWLRIVDELEDASYSFDATVLPDGVYRFRLTASDAPAQANGSALAADKVSEPVVIDHTPPELIAVERAGGELKVELRDALNPLRDAVYSVDAQAWESARTADGLLDGRHETVLLKVPEGARMLLLRVTDAAHNVITFDLLSRAKP